MGRPPIDLKGQRFGKLTAIEIAEHGGSHKPVKWLCQCDCGNFKTVESQLLRRNIITDCGCGVKNRLVGKRFGRLIVVEASGKTEPRSGAIIWKCKCDCGNTTYVSTSNLMAKKNFTVSCGCLRREKATRHNMSGTSIYSVYQSMKDRCRNPNNPNYHRYGGRGITVCDEWMAEGGFDAFYTWAISNGYQPGLTLDRTDNNKGYSPQNCRWVTQKRQMNNQSGNHYITIGDETHSLTEWAEVKGISVGTIRDRLSRGWSDYDAVTKPIRKTKRRA